MTSTAQRKEWNYRYKTCCTVLYDKTERADKRPVVCRSKPRQRTIRDKAEFRREFERERMNPAARGRKGVNP